MFIEEIWDIIEANNLKSMVSDIWLDGDIVCINARSARTVDCLEQLFENYSNSEIMVTL
jgi:hypothetical protein